MNELEERYKSQGLSIIGVTSEAAASTEPWIAEHGAKYAYGYDKGGKLFSYVGASGYPNSVLFDPSGKAVWQGHPGELQNSTIEKALTGALPKLPWEWEPALQPAAQLLSKRQYAKALTEAEKAGEPGKTLADAIRGIVRARVTALKAAKEAGDYLTVIDEAKSLAKELAGLPEAVEVAAIDKAVADDKNAQDIAKGQRQVREFLEQKIKNRDLPNVLKKLEKIQTDLPDTAAARDAAKAILKLRRRD